MSIVKDYIFRVRLNRLQRQKLEWQAHCLQVSTAELVRDYIKSLPAPPEKDLEKGVDE